MTQNIDGGPIGAGPPDAVSTSITAQGGNERNQAVEAHTKPRSVRLLGETEGLQPGGASAGINEGRLNQVRAAIADGSYRIDSQQIADCMLAVATL